jgi:hypothetical protein
MRRVAVLAALSLLLASCGRLGVGEPECEATIRAPSTANVLAAQAVPSAKYAPCINAMNLAWDGLTFEAESGEAGFEISRGLDVVLRATLTEQCDTTGAGEVPSGYNDIRRFEDVASVPPEVTVRIIPTSERPLVRARTLAEAYSDTDIDSRPLLVDVDDDLHLAVRDRVNRALLGVDFVWIITELDIDENTLELRSDPESSGFRGLFINDALDLMEDQLEDVTYEGSWYFTFTGGCIIYEFDASGPVAETIAEDTEAALGFYPLFELRRLARRLGYDIGGAESE